LNTITTYPQISEAFEVLSDSNKRAVFDQLGEEGLKGGGRPSPGAGPGPTSTGGFPGHPSFSDSRGNTFTFSTGGGGGYAPSDPNTVFEQFFKMSGAGGGGMPGMRSMFGGDGDDPMSGLGGSSNTNTYTYVNGVPLGGKSNGGGGGGGRSGRPSSFGGPSTSQPPAEITRPLKVSLEELYTGTTKRLKIGRKLLNGFTEDKILEIEVQPGWKSGTKVRFPYAGNEQSSGESQDLVFVVEEKPHEQFERDGSDLVCHLKIPLVDALDAPSSGKKPLDTLDGRRLQVTLPGGIVKPGQETKIVGEGMPIRKDGSVKRKGDLTIKWDVVFPDRLTPAQKQGIRKVLT